MKKFIIKNAMALVALAISGTTLMSFGLEKINPQQEKWFAVDSNTGEIETTPLSGEPTDNCIIDEPAPTCAVELPENHPYSNMSEITEEVRTAGQRN